MNIPNDPAMPVEEGEEIAGEMVETVTFRIDREEEVTVRVTFEPKNGGEDGYGSIPDPSAKVIGERSVYSLSPGKEGELLMTATLPVGDYTIEITGLNGREYRYRVTGKGEQDG